MFAKRLRYPHPPPRSLLVGMWMAKHIVCLLLFLSLKDVRWRDYRLLLSRGKECAEIATPMVRAYMDGFRSFRAYKAHLWRQRLKVPALMQGEPVLALHKGQKTILERRMRIIEDRAWKYCGAYPVIYTARGLTALRILRDQLTGYERDVLIDVAGCRGWDLSDENYQYIGEAERALRAELYGD